MQNTSSDQMKGSVAKDNKVSLDMRGIAPTVTKITEKQPTTQKQQYIKPTNLYDKPAFTTSVYRSTVLLTCYSKVM
ncbi:Hypothetical predicted protein [Octopus vulgaris]|uniref:Uncharacterized protein n=1 Tax=Octopus vulgaris TaxID=6645 RepID=A0AA36AS61_OCTVU|nr:Hypothetical predicted protein [Octopus vulgaris]